MNFAVILAAGMGSRMKSKNIKVLHPILGRPMVQWSIDVANEIDFESVVVVGHQESEVRDALKGQNIRFARQSTPLGTGHAVLCALEALPTTDVTGEHITFSTSVTCVYNLCDRFVLE